MQQQIQPISRSHCIRVFLRINNASTNLVLSSGGGDYTIPASGSLILDQGSLSISGNSTGITLNGLLEINGGSVSVYNAANTNNYIQYSSTGDARINITGGSLRVGSQIRRFTTTSGGVLAYSQTGGTVEVGYADAPVANRGVFEVVNTGSSFTLTGGTLTILRGQTRCYCTFVIYRTMIIQYRFGNDNKSWRRNR